MTAQQEGEQAVQVGRQPRQGEGWVEALVTQQLLRENERENKMKNENKGAATQTSLVRILAALLAATWLEGSRERKSARTSTVVWLVRSL